MRATKISENIVRYQTEACGVTIYCDVIRAGADSTIAVYDSVNGHVGCAALSTARPSLTGSGTGVTTSILNCLGHKEETIARMFSEAAAVFHQGTAACTCGIHIDQINPEQIAEINRACRKLAEGIWKA